jgi:hypothetical protein
MFTKGRYFSKSFEPKGLSIAPKTLAINNYSYIKPISNVKYDVLIFIGINFYWEDDVIICLHWRTAGVEFSQVSIYCLQRSAQQSSSTAVLLIGIALLLILRQRWH